MADAAVSKTVVERRASSTLASGTTKIKDSLLGEAVLDFESFVSQEINR